jgi:hypothetical protein
VKQELPRGAVLSLDQTWALAKLWYQNRLDPAWRRPTAAEANDAFASIGLSGDFWKF